MITTNSFAMGVTAFSQALMLVLWLGVLLDDFGKSKADKTFGRNGTIVLGILALCSFIVVSSSIIAQFQLTKTTITKSVTTKVVYNGKNPDAVSITQTRTLENDPYNQKVTNYSPTDTRLVDVLKTKTSKSNKLSLTVKASDPDKYDDDFDIRKVYFEDTPPHKNVSKIKLVSHKTRSKSNWSIFTLVKTDCDLIVETTN